MQILDISLFQWCGDKSREIDPLIIVRAKLKLEAEWDPQVNLSINIMNP